MDKFSFFANRISSFKEMLLGPTILGKSVCNILYR